jgi:hypothetical protein
MPHVMIPEIAPPPGLDAGTAAGCCPDWQAGAADGAADDFLSPGNAGPLVSCAIECGSQMVAASASFHVKTSQCANRKKQEPLQGISTPARWSHTRLVAATRGRCSFRMLQLRALCDVSEQTLDVGRRLCGGAGGLGAGDCPGVRVGAQTGTWPNQPAAV